MLPNHILLEEIRTKLRLAQADVEMYESTLSLLSPKHFTPYPVITDGKVLSGAEMLSLLIAYRNAYLYTQMRLQSVGYNNWAQDRDADFEEALSRPETDFCSNCEHWSPHLTSGCSLYSEKPVSFCLRFSRK